MNNRNDDSLVVLVLKIIALFALCIFMVSCSRTCSRSTRNMAPIEHGYCYDLDTQIIYIESYTGRYGDETAYTPYYDANGNLCKYDIYTGEWLPIE